MESLIESLANFPENLIWLDCTNTAHVVDDTVICPIWVPAPRRGMVAEERHASCPLAGRQMHGAAVVSDEEHRST
jgi:hypothetical protein